MCERMPARRTTTTTKIGEKKKSTKERTDGRGFALLRWYTAAAAACIGESENTRGGGASKYARMKRFNPVSAQQGLIVEISPFVFFTSYSNSLTCQTST